MEQSRLKELEGQCIQECAPPCTSLCPVHVDIRQMALALGGGDFSGGYKVFRKLVPFPEIIARTCDQPCQVKCNRKELGGDIRVADLERSCVQYGAGSLVKITILPQKNARVAVIGGGLSGLTAAFELSRKGYQVCLFEQNDQLGGQLWNYSEDQLPRDILINETNLISQTGVDIHLGEKVDSSQKILDVYDAFYLGSGLFETADVHMLTTQNGLLQVDPATFQTSQSKIFAGGSLLHSYSPIFSISDGRRAAISIDRFLQNVSLTASRENEGAYETRLFTNTSRYTHSDAILPAHQSDGYSQEEAVSEAKRCLQCDCMECVKVCEYLKHYGSYPKKYIREVYNNLSIIMHTRTANKFVNSCTLCGLCGEVCPTDLDMGKVNSEVRKTMVETGKMPISAHDFALRDMAFSNSDKFAVTLTRDGSATCSYLFFPGCQLAASNPEYIPQIFQTLQSVIPDIGLMLRCCGAPADWSGEEELFQQVAADIRNKWQALGHPEFVLACSSCNQMLRKILPDAKLHSIWEVFGQYGLYPKGSNFEDKQYVVHDPCTSRYEQSWHDSARKALNEIGVSFHELPMSRNMTVCCGYGGVAWLAHPELVHDIVQRRVAEDPADYLTYCVMCRDLFVHEGKRTLHVLDLIYGKDLEALASRQGPDYSQRHENRARVRQKMLQVISGKEINEVESFEKYQLILNPEMQNRIEARLILVEDIQKVIEHAETSGERFINQANGHTLAYFKPNLITYWVEYTRMGESYEIHDAYSHRMDFEGDASI